MLDRLSTHPTHICWSHIVSTNHSTTVLIKHLSHNDSCLLFSTSALPAFAVTKTLYLNLITMQFVYCYYYPLLCAMCATPITPARYDLWYLLLWPQETVLRRRYHHHTSHSQMVRMVRASSLDYDDFLLLLLLFIVIELQGLIGLPLSLLTVAAVGRYRWNAHSSIESKPNHHIAWRVAACLFPVCPEASSTILAYKRTATSLWMGGLERREQDVSFVVPSFGSCQLLTVTECHLLLGDGCWPCPNVARIHYIYTFNIFNLFGAMPGCGLGPTMKRRTTASPAMLPIHFNYFVLCVCFVCVCGVPCATFNRPHRTGTCSFLSVGFQRIYIYLIVDNLLLGFYWFNGEAIRLAGRRLIGMMPVMYARINWNFYIIVGYIWIGISHIELQYCSHANGDSGDSEGMGKDDEFSLFCLIIYYLFMLFVCLSNAHWTFAHW